MAQTLLQIVVVLILCVLAYFLLAPAGAPAWVILIVCAVIGWKVGSIRYD